MRVGHGFDMHRIQAVAGGSVVLGGVRIRCDLQVEAYSDGDVLLHALCDALLGAAGLGDIGRHFPPGEPRWKDADSTELLRSCHSMLRDQGWQLVNADLTLIAERPRIASHIRQMCARIADCLQVDGTAVNVKATTTEGLGAVGRGEGIAAQAVVSIAAGGAAE